ncbi:MAG: hypothetical protein Q8L57_02315, partial [bacterium]|nr:hypothetical protein [bacterium]
LDMLPHREYPITGITEPGSKNFPKSAARILVDFSLGLGLVIWAAPPEINFFYLGTAVFAGILPDFLLFLAWLQLKNPSLRKFNVFWDANLKLARFHRDIIHTKKPPAAIGWGIQIIFSFILLFLLL